MRKLFYYQDEDFSLSHTLDLVPDAGAFRMHTHSQTELFYFVQGKGVFHIEGTAYPLERGDLLIMGPSEAHYIDIDYSQSYERKVLQFNTGCLDRLDPRGILRKAITEREPGKQNLYRGLHTEPCWEAMMSPAGDNRTNVLCGLLPLLNQVYQAFTASANAPDGGSDTTEQQVIRYVNEHLSQPLHLDDICQEFYISKSQLLRLFKNATGTTLYQYLTVKRLMLAHQLLLEGKSPTYIYSLCGFTDYSTFYRAYKKQFGRSPKLDQSEVNL